MKKVIEEFEEVVLVNDLPKFGLRAGDIGVIVDIHGNNVGYTLEFMTRDGQRLPLLP